MVSYIISIIRILRILRIISIISIIRITSIISIISSYCNTLYCNTVVLQRREAARLPGHAVRTTACL